MFAQHVTRDTNSLFPDYIFMDVCIPNSLIRYRESIPLEQKTGVLKFNKDNVYPLSKVWADMLASHYKKLVFLRFRVPQLW